MESRRLLAAQDLQTGLSQSQIARKFGVSRTTASRWNRTLERKRRRVAPQTARTGPSQPLDRGSTQSPHRHLSGGTARVRLRHRPLDHGPLRRGDFHAVRRALRSGSCGTHHASSGLARAPPFAEGSRRTCFTRSRLPRRICRKFRRTWRKGTDERLGPLRNRSRRLPTCPTCAYLAPASFKTYAWRAGNAGRYCVGDADLQLPALTRGFQLLAAFE